MSKFNATSMEYSADIPDVQCELTVGRYAHDEDEAGNRILRLSEGWGWTASCGFTMDFEEEEFNGHCDTQAEAETEAVAALLNQAEAYVVEAQRRLDAIRKFANGHAVERMVRAVREAGDS
jgi:phytoene/squalene synthetase